MLGGSGKTVIIGIITLIVLDQCTAAPTNHGAPGYRASRRLTSSKRNKKLRQREEKLSDKMKLGLNKAGIVNNWSVESKFQLSPIKDSDTAPIEYIKAKPQLNGKMGNAKPPRRLNARKQYVPKAYVAPDAKLLTAPAGLQELSDDDKLTIATDFWVTYNYTYHQLSSPDELTRRMQRNYGLPETGELDEATITAMLQPRCGVPDGPAEYNTFPNREHWTNLDVTYTINGYTPDMSQCQVRNAFKRAFRVWEEVTNLNFKMIDSDKADIIIYFGYEEHGDGYPFDGPNGLLAHAFTPGTQPLSGDSHFDEGEFWTLGKGRVFDTYNGNGGGKPCSFPFYFEDKQYEACTSIGRDDGLQWCATTPDFDKDKEWAFCPHEGLFTYGGNSENDPCRFPFVFLGKSYDACTHEGRSDGYKWCSTTSDFDADGKWGFCPDRAHGTEGGNANGAGCVFPFNFQGYQYNECTTQGRSDYKLWCSTTSDYDVDGLYGFCNEEGYSLFLVATHEFGHAIGLDHSSVPGALMYPVYSYHADFVLPTDDIRGAQDLYGGPRTEYLPPLQLETCGGDLTESEPTSRPPKTKPTRRPTTTKRPRTTTPAIVDRCNTDVKPNNICERTIDAAMLYQDELFVFQGPFVWRVKGTGSSQARTVEPIKNYWKNLGCGVTAAYQREHDEKVVFFKGTKVYEYDGLNIAAGYPKDVTTLGLPSRTEIGGVVFLKTKNPVTKRNEKRLYYLSGDKVYRANVTSEKVLEGVEPSILKKTKAWKDIPRNIDAVYREPSSKPYTIFVKGNKYYRYMNNKGRLDYHRNIKQLFRCPEVDELVALPLREET